VQGRAAAAALARPNCGCAPLCRGIRGLRVHLPGPRRLLLAQVGFDSAQCNGFGRGLGFEVAVFAIAQGHGGGTLEVLMAPWLKLTWVAMCMGRWLKEGALTQAILGSYVYGPCTLETPASRAGCTASQQGVHKLCKRAAHRGSPLTTTASSSGRLAACTAASPPLASFLDPRSLVSWRPRCPPAHAQARLPECDAQELAERGGCGRHPHAGRLGREVWARRWVGG